MARMKIFDSLPGAVSSRRCFSLLEIVLALAVVAFGLVSVMALLPASIKAGRDSVSETHSATVADYLIQILSSRMEGATTQDAWETQALCLPTAKPGLDEPENGWNLWSSQDGIRIWRAGDDHQFYRVDMRRNSAESPEFTAVCRVWRKQVSISEYDGSTWSSRTLDWDDAIELNVEVSWPAGIPYVRRNKALFALNVFSNVE